MSKENTDFQKLTRWNAFWRTLLLISVGCIVVILIFQYLDKRRGQLHGSWREDSFHVFSITDGPFIVTHLFIPWQDNQPSTVAQLNPPVTIIDSRGHHFTMEQISSMTWIDASGKQLAPPAIGSPLKTFYIVPKQAE